MSGRLREAQGTQLPPHTELPEDSRKSTVRSLSEGWLQGSLEEGDSERVCVAWGTSVSPSKQGLWSLAWRLNPGPVTSELCL